MKIAVVTDDGKTISRHFGRALYYLVVEVEAGNEIARSLRDKMGHHEFSGTEEKTIEQRGFGHGFDPASQKRHEQMLNTINDCQVVIAGGMGRGAYQSMADTGKEVYVVSTQDVDQALDAYLGGTIENMMDLIH